jgi:hypothetical protein
MTITYPETVRDNEHSGALEAVMHNTADGLIGLGVDTSRRFVHDEDLVLTKDGTGENDELFLTSTQAIICQPDLNAVYNV